MKDKTINEEDPGKSDREKAHVIIGKAYPMGHKAW